jgi:hypothetical protein
MYLNHLFYVCYLIYLLAEETVSGSVKKTMSGSVKKMAGSVKNNG